MFQQVRTSQSFCYTTTDSPDRPDYNKCQKWTSSSALFKEPHPCSLSFLKLFQERKENAMGTPANFIISGSYFLKKLSDYKVFVCPKMLTWQTRKLYMEVKMKGGIRMCMFCLRYVTQVKQINTVKTSE